MIRFGYIFFVELNSARCVINKNIRKTKKKISEIKWLTTAPSAPKHTLDNKFKTRQPASQALSGCWVQKQGAPSKSLLSDVF